MQPAAKKAIIIGASSGIGYALAKVLSQKGYAIGLTGRRVELLRKLQKEITGISHIQSLDLNVPEEASHSLEALIGEMGGLDLLVVNSGVDFPDADLDLKTHRAILQVNVVGFMAMCHAAYRYFKKQQSGHLVGISSVAATRGNGRSPAYSASKAFVSNYMEGLRQRMSLEGIRVTDIRPGFIDTPMIQERKYVFWMISADKAACQIYQAIEKQKKIAYIPGRWRFVAWLMRAVPIWLYDKAFQRVMKSEKLF